jgi:hypothetical protein
VSSNGILQAFKAEALLADADILVRIESLRKNLQYSSEGQQVSFNDYLKVLRDAVDAVPKLELDTDVVPGTENTYSIQLVTSMEKIVDDCDRVLRKLAHFQGRLRDAERQINNAKAEFIAWYLLAAGSLLAGLEDVKLPARELRLLADAEFSRLMTNMDLKVVAILEDLKLEFERVSQHKATQKEKHNLGKDQANASWTSTLPAYGGAITENDRTDKFAKEPEEEEDEEGIPAFISRKPQMNEVQDNLQAALNKAKPGDTILIRNIENIAPKIAEIQDKPIVGTFKKVISAPVKAVNDENGEPIIITSPRKRLIDEDVF